MALKQLRLLPERRDQGSALVCRSELAACSMRQFRDRIRAVIRQRVALESDPQVFHRVELRRIGRKKIYRHATIQRVEVIPNKTRTVCSESVPDDQQ